MRVESRLRELGIELPNLPVPAGSFVDCVQVGNLLFSSGKGARGLDGNPIVGRVGETVSVDEAYEHSRLITLYLMASWKQALGNLDRVKRVVKVLALVNATPDFKEHPKVVNGCSDFLLNVFGDAGRHARSAMGAGSLPNGISVEIEAIVETD
jgi:enamine deaminase RidA (YjgF/YER057c/UK114 family)